LDSFQRGEGGKLPISRKRTGKSGIDAAPFWVRSGAAGEEPFSRGETFMGARGNEAYLLRKKPEKEKIGGSQLLGRGNKKRIKSSRYKVGQYDASKK